MTKMILKVFVICILFSMFFKPDQACSLGWSDFAVRSLPDSSFALVEYDKNGIKVKHFPYRDKNGHIDMDQLIYCLGTFAGETWADPKNEETARKHLGEHYMRFKLKQRKEGITEPVDINKASPKELVRLPNIGPVTAVKIYKYRERHGPFDNIEGIKKVEGIGSTIFAGIRYYIRVH